MKMRFGIGALAVALLPALGIPAHGEGTLVVYLPSAPIESAARLGEAVTDLGTYLNQQVPGLGLNVRPFRKAEDARAFVQSAASEVALVLSEGPFLLDLPGSFGAVPACRVVRSGNETQRKLVIVPVASPARSLADLRGKSLSLAYGGGEGSARFLARVIFDGQIVPESWFATTVPEPDEFTAAANALYGRADAALVSDDNPLVAAQIGKGLRAVYTSPAVTLPVISFRTGALRPDQQSAVEAALLAVSRRPEGKKILEGLRIDGFARIGAGSGRMERSGLLTLPADERRLPEVVTSLGADWKMPALPKPDGKQVPFALGLPLPDLSSVVLPANAPTAKAAP